MYHVPKNKLLYCSIVLITLKVLITSITRKPNDYKYLKKDYILGSLFEETAKNFSSTAVVDCDYEDILDDKTSLLTSILDGDIIESHLLGSMINEGGEYAPLECRPKFSVALIVPYRDRAEQLRSFLVYMHRFLNHQFIHYRIYIVEQLDTQPFNRAKLMNVGAIAAMAAGYPCLIFHDVDLLPLRPANLYACTISPRHMAASISKFRFLLPYLTSAGGVISMVSSQFQEINGMSNDYFGWGEDDDLYDRLEAHNLTLCRFDPITSQYHMFIHKDEDKGEQRKILLSFSKQRMMTDGLNTLKYTEVQTVLHPLFTHIKVNL